MHEEASQLTFAAVNARGSCSTAGSVQSLEDALLAKFKAMPSITFIIEADGRVGACSPQGSPADAVRTSFVDPCCTVAEAATPGVEAAASGGRLVAVEGRSQVLGGQGFDPISAGDFCPDVRDSVFPAGRDRSHADEPWNTTGGCVVTRQQIRDGFGIKSLIPKSTRMIRQPIAHGRFVLAVVSEERNLGPKDSSTCMPHATRH